MTGARGDGHRADRIRFDVNRGGSGNATGDWTIKRPRVDPVAVHHLHRVFPRHSGLGAVALSLFRLADNWLSNAWLANCPRRFGPELCGLRITGLSRGARSDSTRTVG